jgi:hypothetical protein
MLRRVAQPRSFVKRREGFKRAHDELRLTPRLRTNPGSDRLAQADLRRAERRRWRRARGEALRTHGGVALLAALDYHPDPEGISCAPSGGTTRSAASSRLALVDLATARDRRAPRNGDYAPHRDLGEPLIWMRGRCRASGAGRDRSAQLKVCTSMNPRSLTLTTRRELT